MKIRTITCSRCGEQIRGNPVHILFQGKKNAIKLYQNLFQQMDFCKECIEEIIAFALNKDVCEECIREMGENAALLRTADEKEGSDIWKKTDPDEIDWNGELDRLNKIKPSIKYMVPREKVVNAVKSIRKDRQYQSIQLRGADPVDIHGGLQ